MAPVLTLLGTGTPAPLTHRAGSSYLLELAGEKLLIDCGPGSVRRLLETGVSPTEIAGLLLTHLHYDHCVDYAHFVNGAIEDPRLTECCSGHLDAARTAQAAGVGTLVLVHITESVERPGIKERVLHEAGEVFAGSIVFAEDLLQVPLDGIEVERIR